MATVEDDGAVLRHPSEGRPADVFVVPDSSPSHEAALRDATRTGSAAAGQELGLVVAGRPWGRRTRVVGVAMWLDLDAGLVRVATGIG